MIFRIVCRVAATPSASARLPWTAEAAGNEESVVQESAVGKALGMAFSGLTEDARKTYKIKDSVKGVIVTSVEAGSSAAERGLRPGDVIEEVNHQAVEKPADLAKAIEAVKKDSAKKPALLLVANGEGLARFVAVPVE